MSEPTPLWSDERITERMSGWYGDDTKNHERKLFEQYMRWMRDDYEQVMTAAIVSLSTRLAESYRKLDEYEAEHAALTARVAELETENVLLKEAVSLLEKALDAAGESNGEFRLKISDLLWENTRLKAQLAANNAAGQWMPVPNGFFQSHARTSLSAVSVDGDLLKVYATELGEWQHEVSISLPDSIRLCYLASEPQSPAMADDWAKTVDYLVSLAPAPEPTYDAPEPPDDYDEEDSPHYDTPGGY